MLDEADESDFGLTAEMREQFTKQLAALDKRENYLLDLAADEGWPKEKLRDKISAIRTEQAAIHRALSDAEGKLETGRGVFYTALGLLERPAEMYKVGNEIVRATLNKRRSLPS